MSSRAERRFPGARGHRTTLSPIHLPPLSSPRDGPRHDRAGQSTARCHMRPPRGGCQPPVTPGGGYGLRRAPKCLTDNVRHRPTIHRLRQYPSMNRRDFGPPSSGPGGERHRRPRPQAVGWGDASPRLEPTAAPSGGGSPRCGKELSPRLTVKLS